MHYDKMSSPCWGSYMYIYRLYFQLDDDVGVEIIAP